MSSPENGDRVNNRQLYDAITDLEKKIDAKLEKFATKGDVTVRVTLALFAVSGLTTAATHLSPPAQVAAVAHLVQGLWS